MAFSHLGLSAKVIAAIESAGYKTPTPIQDQAIPHVLARRDVLGIAQTGTGKTAAFVLPMLTMLEKGRARARMPRTLILAPTRELAAQGVEQFEKRLEHGFFADRSHEDGDGGPAFLVSVAVVPESLAGDNLEIVGRTNRIGQMKVAVARHGQMRLQLFLAEMLKAAGSNGNGTVAKNIPEESLEEAHRLVLVTSASGLPWQVLSRGSNLILYGPLRATATKP